MTNSEKLTAIREIMRDKGLDACIIPSTDPHMGEYIPAHWSSREWVSGFTGSAGTVVITLDFAGVWTDSRYFIQAEEQLKDSEFELVKLKIPHTPEHIDWLKKKLPNGSSVLVDGKVVSTSTVRFMKSELESSGIDLETGFDIIGKAWPDRPELPRLEVFDHELKYSGESREDKINRLREEMKAKGADHTLICTLDEIAWLLNLRGKDVPYNPVFVGYVLVAFNEVILFTNPDKIPCELFGELQSLGISIMEYNAVPLILSQLKSGTTIAIDPGKTNFSLYKSIPESCIIFEELGVVTRMKSIKNDKEIEGLKKVMVKDGIAWVKFLHWLESNLGKIRITELSAANKLASFRAEQEHYMGDSFHPISSYAHHGAVVHYSVDEESDIELKKSGIYLCDTGGHYLDGTTDTTRTITLGDPTDQQKRDFTLALKGTLGVSMLRFPKGTKGYQMDILARKALWDYGFNFGHGTGHGVGFYLNVHEGPQTIGTGASGNMQTSFEPGMATTVEPAIYRDGEYGMRTENITLVIKDIETEFGEFYCFETLTLAPIDINLINPDLLSGAERVWLNEYHQKVLEKLGPQLESDELAWLKNKTRSL